MPRAGQTTIPPGDAGEIKALRDALRSILQKFGAAEVRPPGFNPTGVPEGSREESLKLVAGARLLVRSEVKLVRNDGLVPSMPDLDADIPF